MTQKQDSTFPDHHSCTLKTIQPELIRVALWYYIIPGQSRRTDCFPTEALSHSASSDAAEVCLPLPVATIPQQDAFSPRL